MKVIDCVKLTQEDEDLVQRIVEHLKRQGAFFAVSVDAQGVWLQHLFRITPEQVVYGANLMIKTTLEENEEYE